MVILSVKGSGIGRSNPLAEWLEYSGLHHSSTLVQPNTGSREEPLYSICNRTINQFKKTSTECPECWKIQTKWDERGIQKFKMRKVWGIILLWSDRLTMVILFLKCNIQWWAPQSTNNCNRASYSLSFWRDLFTVEASAVWKLWCYDAPPPQQFSAQLATETVRFHSSEMFSGRDTVKCSHLFVWH